MAGICPELGDTLSQLLPATTVACQGRPATLLLSVSCWGASAAAPAAAEKLKLAGETEKEGTAANRTLRMRSLEIRSRMSFPPSAM